MPCYIYTSQTAKNICPANPESIPPGFEKVYSYDATGKGRYDHLDV